MRHLLWIWFLIISCSSVQHTTGIDGNAKYVNDTIQPDPRINAVLSPYQSAISENMAEVIARVTTPLEKQRPEGTLGNWLSDALRNTLIRQGHDVDLAILNYGGVRIPSVGVGDLTIGRIYEIWPFDDPVVILHLTGNELLTFLRKIADSGGWPISSGNKMVIHRKKMESFLHNGKEVDADKVYNVAVTKYVAQGGDDTDFLKTVSQTELTILVRDAFIEEARYLGKLGQPVQSVIESRIVNHQP